GSKDAIRFMKKQLISISAIAFDAQADVLESKNGKVLTGSYVGGTASTIRFQTAQNLEVIETSQALALTFTASGGTPAGAAPAPAAGAAPAAAGAAAAPAPSPVSVPAGTALVVRMVDGASSNDSKGKRFTTTLESDLIVGGQMVAKAGTKKAP